MPESSVSRPVLLLATLGLVVSAAGCPASSKPDKKKLAAVHETGPTDAGAIDAATRSPDGKVILPSAPPTPMPPLGLPPLTAAIGTAEELALGELLFYEPRLGADGTTACASCHDPKNGYSGTEAHPQTAAGRPSLRRAPALINLAWARELGWDGRGADLASWLPNHATSQLGQSFDDASLRLIASPTYAAHWARASVGRGHADTALAALSAFARSRWEGGSPWDAHEAGTAGAVDAEVIAGYQLFTGKGLCATCHPPPLYSDNDFHRLGLIASPDDGRGRVDPVLRGAFKTPGLRGVARRAPLFHDGSAPDLDHAIDWHLAGGRGQGADPSVIDPGLPPVVLSVDERRQLGSFVRALTAPRAPPIKPNLPLDVP
jgi:cytochrome c peroxidase